MIKRILTPLFLAACFILGAVPFASAQTSPAQGRIVVKVIAFRSSNGSIELSLYDKKQAEADFPDIEVITRRTRNPVVNSSVTEVVFDNVPYGSYAIAGHHDENDNGEMDYNFIGLPKEGYCFSNDAKPVLSAPSFDKAEFRLDSKEKVLYVAMQY
ncbi:MAG: DUF2141 domain-containing protein [Bacteroidota bacterium]